MNGNGNFELFWSRLTRAVGLILGTAIMVYETIADKSDRPWLYAAAVGLIGLPVAKAAEGILGRLGGTGTPQEEPPQTRRTPARSDEDPK